MIVDYSPRNFPSRSPAPLPRAPWYVILRRVFLTLLVIAAIVLGWAWVIHSVVAPIIDRLGVLR